MPATGQRANPIRDARICSMLREGKSNRQVAKIVGVSRSTVCSVRFRHGLCKPKDALAAEAVKNMSRSGLEGREIARISGINHTSVSTILNLPPENDGTATPSIIATRKEKDALRMLFAKEARILCVFDTHIPHIYRPALEAALRAEGAFDLVILGGDELDNTRYSRFRPDEAASVADELKMACDIEDQLRNKASMLWKLRGNHDERLRKMILDRLADILPRMHKDAQGQMMKAVDQVERWHHDRGKEGIIYHPDFWMMTGNAERPNVIGHPDRYTKAKYATVTGFRDWLHEQDYRPGSICIGHLHRYVPWAPAGGVWMSEMPAMCQRMAYMVNAKAYGGALHTGYGVLVQDKNGRFVPNKSYVHFCEAL